MILWTSLCPPAGALDVRAYRGLSRALRGLSAAGPDQCFFARLSSGHLVLQGIPPNLSAVWSFARVLESSDPLIPMPPIDGLLCLLPVTVRDAPGSNPFEYRPGGGADGPGRCQTPRIGSPPRSDLLALGMCIWVPSNGERSTLTRPAMLLHRIEAYPLHQNNEYSHKLFMEVSTNMKESLGLDSAAPCSLQRGGRRWCATTS